MKLSDSVEVLPLVGQTSAQKLARLKIVSLQDLLYHLPSRYLDFRNTKKISGLEIGEVATVKGRIVSIDNVYTKNKKNMQKAIVADSSGRIQAVWFNQSFLLRSLKEGMQISLAGEISLWAGGKTMLVPEYEIVQSGRSLHTGRLIPIYPLTSGVSSKWLRSRIDATYKIAIGQQLLHDFLPSRILQEENLLSLKTALKALHYPKDEKEILRGRERLALNELLFLEIANLKRKKTREKKRPRQKLEVDSKLVQKFTNNLTFELTGAQKRVLKEVLVDLQNTKPMDRLLAGDVGSGKTLIAAAGALIAAVNNSQSLFMAPTQILAHQHYATLKKLLSPFKVKLALIAAGEKKGSLQKADIIVGTHALLAKKQSFKKAAFVVIDEQHRFGVKQRQSLVKKAETDKLPHVLTMTATPIPRTVALSLFGNLDISILDELPKGRKPPTTWVVPSAKKQGAYAWMEKEIRSRGIQAFVICPLIEESDKESMQQVRAAKSEFQSLQNVLPNLKIGLLHGRQKLEEKNKVLSQFRHGRLNVLVATPVVEVGIDIPNANIMIIEGAERFGLAQLHQLRGRIGRGTKKAYCLLFSEKASEKTKKRLSLLQKNKTGFELAEADLKLRGPGEVFGTQQHGFMGLKIASWQDEGLMHRSRILAKKLFKNQELRDKIMEYGRT